ncbi:AraC family transcriptional regulator [Bacteroidia bacterium]|nr:AraC family transcriptional regulator [Bacteroidia bacterium]
MLVEYTLSDILSLPAKHIAYYADTVERLQELKIEWPHRQTFYSIVWFMQGEGRKVIDFQEHQICKGRMFFVSPDQIMNGSYTDNCKGYVLLIAKPLASQLCIEFSNPCIDITKEETPLLRLVFENLIRDCRLEKEDVQNKIMTSIQYFYSLLASRIHNEAFPVDANTQLFRQFKELILTDDAKIQSLNQYADLLHISTSVLNEMCQDFSGISAKQFLLELKMTEAKRLLLYSKANINEISYQLGFEDASYFARIFRKKGCMTPTRFREKYRR